MRGVGHPLAVPPHRPRPGGIGLIAPDHMHVELADHVAERADVELVGFRDRAQRLGRLHGLVEQLLPLGRREIEDFGDIGPARYQHQPGKARIVEQEDAGERPFRQRMADLFETRIELETGFGHGILKVLRPSL